MIKLTTPNTSGIGVHYVNAENISRITEASTSSKWHGIMSIVRLFDGGVLEVSQKADWIAEKVNTPGHTEQEVQEILAVASQGQIGEMTMIEDVVRRVLKVPH